MPQKARVRAPDAGQDLVPYRYAHDLVQEAWRRLADSPEGTSYDRA